MISVIIPAHNEAAVILRCLTVLTAGCEPGELDVVVVCNGCNDGTAAQARSFGQSVRVMETETASKVHALNLGDQVARGFPRFYVDADVNIDLGTLRTLAQRLNAGGVLAVAPRFRMDLTGCSWAVRAFYAVNDRLPSSREGIGGSGVYGLSEAGRQRFGRFPDITADDAFVRIHFASSERDTLEGCFSTVFAARGLRDLIRIKTRSHLGSAELRERFPELWCNRGATNGKSLRKMLWRIWMWPLLAVYAYVKLMARWRARRRWASGKRTTWERDDTSRVSQTS